MSAAFKSIDCDEPPSRRLLSTGTLEHRHYPLNWLPSLVSRPWRRHPWHKVRRDRYRQVPVFRWYLLACRRRDAQRLPWSAVSQHESSTIVSSRLLPPNWPLLLLHRCLSERSVRNASEYWGPARRATLKNLTRCRWGHCIERNQASTLRRARCNRGSR